MLVITNISVRGGTQEGQAPCLSGRPRQGSGTGRVRFLYPCRSRACSCCTRALISPLISGFILWSAAWASSKNLMGIQINPQGTGPDKDRLLLERHLTHKE